MQSILFKDPDFIEFRKMKMVYQSETGKQLSDWKYVMAISKIVNNSIKENNNANQENSNTKKDSSKKGNS